jgi:hypothetical protein
VPGRKLPEDQDVDRVVAGHWPPLLTAALRVDNNSAFGEDFKPSDGHARAAPARYPTLR